MKLKKVIALLLVSVMSVSILAACGSKDDGGTATTPTTPSGTDSSAGSVEAPKPGDPVNEAAEAVYAKYPFLPRTGMEFDEPIVVTRFSDATAIQIASDNPFLVALETITNIKIETEYLVGDPYEKFGVMIASGDLPDMVSVGVGEQPYFMEAGVYMPLQDLVEQFAPRYRQQFDKYWNYMFREDGNKYVMSVWDMPTGNTGNLEHWGCAFYLQKDVIDHFGRVPTTLDEYFEFIREYKAIHPTIDGVPTIGFESNMHDWRVWSLLHPSKFLQGYGNWGDAGVADMKTHTVYDPYPMDFYRIFHEKLNDEYLKGTLLAETFTRDIDAFLSTIASGAVLGFFDQLWNFQDGEHVLKQEDRWERTYLPLGLVNDPSVVPHYRDRGMFGANNGFGISVNSPHAERIMKLVNYVIQEDVQKWLTWGVEGEHYYVENGRFKRFDEQRTLQTNEQWVRDNMGRFYRDMLPAWRGTFTCGNSTDMGEQPEEAWDGLSDYDKALFTKLGITSRVAFLGEPVDVPVYYPFWSKRPFNGDMTHPAEQAWVAQVDYLKVALPRLILTAEGGFDAAYEDFLTGLARVDVTPMIEALQQFVNESLR